MMSYRSFKNLSSITRQFHRNTTKQTCERNKTNSLMYAEDFSDFVDGAVKYQQVTAEYVEKTVRLMETSFYPNENISKSLCLADHPEALKELRQLTRFILKDGVSVIAIDRNTDEVVGAALNQIEEKNFTPGKCFAESWNHESSRKFAEFMIYIDALGNLFEHFKIDCFFEISFTVTARGFRVKRVMQNLCELSIDIAKKLSKGIDVRKSSDGTELRVIPRPKIICGVYTTFVSEKVGQSFGFQTLAERRYDEIKIPGMDFRDAIRGGTRKLKIGYRKLIE